MGRCLMPLIVSGAEMPVDFQDRRHNIDDVMELIPDAAQVRDVTRPRHANALRRTAAMRRHLFAPLERCIERPRPSRCKVREGFVRSPEFVPEKLIFNRHGDTVERGKFVRRPVEHSLCARAVVAADVDDQRVVQFAKVFDRLDDAADLVVGVGEIGAVHVSLLDEEFLLFPIERIPLRQAIRPCGQLSVVGHNAQFLLVGKDGVADFVPAAIEEVHVADLLDPFRSRMMRRVCTARHVINEERFVRRNLLELFHVLDRIVSHRCRQIPTGLPLKRIDGRRVAEQVRLPLAGVAADEPVKILEAHTDRPLMERTRLARLIKWRVVILAEPRRRIPVLLENLTNRSAIPLDDRVVTRKSRRRFAHDTKAGYVMVAASDQRRARR